MKNFTLDSSTEEAPIDTGAVDESHYHYDGNEDEASGEEPITETSPVYTRGPDVGCRGDTTYTCPESGKVICDEQRCDGEEQCPDGEDELNCYDDGSEAGETEYPTGTVFMCYLFLCVFQFVCVSLHSICLHSLCCKFMYVFGFDGGTCSKVHFFMLA